ncbi:MAG: YdcF family protein [Anaerolineaceae bacterium]|nr:YdcF family protein [Anaerolineaceae bacterium]
MFRRRVSIFNKRARRIVLLLLIGIGLMIASHRSWLPAVYDFLDVSQEVVKADAILLLGGTTWERLRYSEQLFKDGYAHYFVLDGLGDYIQYAIDSLEETVPQDALIVNRQATSTYDEIMQAREIFEELGIESVLVVTDGFHSRRAAATVHHVFADSDIVFTIVSPPNTFGEQSWWQSKFRDNVLSEYPKIIYYWIAYGIWSG